MSDADALRALAGILGQGELVTDPARTDKYRRDRSGCEPAGEPLAVVRPATPQGVQDAVRWAAEHRVPIVPRGAGSGLSGGATAIDGGIVMSLERLSGARIDESTRTAVAGAGVLTSDLKELAASNDLWYPPDPSSSEISTIGGNVATNAGGLCCVKYGVTRDYVVGLSVVLADGRLVRLGSGLQKDVAGLPLMHLFVGSEGTLGIITECTVRLLPARRSVRTVVSYFPTVGDAVSCVLSVKAAVTPSLVELMDRTCVEAVDDLTRMGLDRSAGALLVTQIDGDGNSTDGEAAMIERLCRDHSATDVFTADDDAMSAELMQARRLALPALERKGALMLEDVGVPLPALPTLFQGITSIAHNLDLQIAVVAHAGDGNVHPIVVYDPANEDQRFRAASAYGDILNLAISLGGTISGEHGVGRLKRAWLHRQLGDDVMALNHQVKLALDPLGILNPGVSA